MANERLYLRCRACGEVLYMGKSYLMGFYYKNYGEDAKPLEEKLNNFYEAHTYCDCDAAETCRMKGQHVAGDGCFELVYEMSDWEPPCNMPDETPKEASK